jgi:hypothetical protein
MSTTCARCCTHFCSLPGKFALISSIARLMQHEKSVAPHYGAEHAKRICEENAVLGKPKMWRSDSTNLASDRQRKRPVPWRRQAKTSQETSFFRDLTLITSFIRYSIGGRYNLKLSPNKKVIP